MSSRPPAFKKQAGPKTPHPRFAALGNHDLGDSDLFATCPEKAPRVTIAGQAYASNQLDASKGGYRPPGAGNTSSFHLPDFNYRATLDALNLEIFGPSPHTSTIQRVTRVLISLWDSLMFGRVPGIACSSRRPAPDFCTLRRLVSSAWSCSFRSAPTVLWALACLRGPDFSPQAWPQPTPCHLLCDRG